MFCQTKNVLGKKISHVLKGSDPKLLVFWQWTAQCEMSVCFVRFLFKTPHACISLWILSQLLSSFWGRHFWGFWLLVWFFGFFWVKEDSEQNKDHLQFTVSSSWWLHVWSLLSVYIVLYTSKDYHRISSVFGTSVYLWFWHLDIFVHLLSPKSS